MNIFSKNVIYKTSGNEMPKKVLGNNQKLNERMLT